MESTLPKEYPWDMPWWKKSAALLLQVLCFGALVSVLVWALGQVLPAGPGLLHPEVAYYFKEFGVLLIAGIAAVWTLDKLHLRAGMGVYGWSVKGIAKALLLGAGLAAILLAGCFGVLWLGQWISVTGTTWQVSAFLSWTVFFLIQPLSEEVIMRSFLQSRVHFYYGKQAGLLVTAAVFSLLHLGNDHINVQGVLQIALGGYCMGLLYLHTQNLWAAASFHAVWNWLQGTVMGFGVSGMTTYHWLNLSLNGPDWLTGGSFGLEGSVLGVLSLLAAIVWLWPQKDNSSAMREWWIASRN